MTLQSSTLRPGLLVSLKTTVTGNVQYDRRTIEQAHLTDGGKLKAAWETTKIVHDPDEADTAAKVRAKARSLIASICAHSAFGMLCPEERTDDLEKAIAEARQLAEEFNSIAKLTRLGVYVITGRIAPDDVEAVRAINSEVRDLLEAMQSGVANLDVKVIRDAADRARGLGSMLSPDAEARIKIAIDTARAAARKIVKAGETAAQEIDKQAIRKITEQRTAFLDLDTKGEIINPTEPGRAVDLSPAEKIAATPTMARYFDLEL